MTIEKISKKNFNINRNQDEEDNMYMPFTFQNHGWTIDILDATEMGLSCAVQVEKDKERYICYGRGTFEEMLDYLKEKKRIPTGNVKKLIQKGMIEEMFRTNTSEIIIDIVKKD